MRGGVLDIRKWAVVVLLAACAAVPAGAQETFKERGLWITYADAFRVTRVEDPRHEYMMIKGRWGLPVPFIASHGDKLGLMIEPNFGWFTAPRQAIGGGASLLFDWRPWGAKGDWVPFADIGGGVFLTDYSGLDGFLNFELQFGVGVHRRIQGPWHATLGWRFHHFSNGGIYKPNVGINANMLMLGATWIP
jgi:hypothetical protein